MPCVFRTDTPYSKDVNLNKEKNIEWFVEQIGNVVQVKSNSYSGPVTINDQAEAKQLFRSQQNGYAFSMPQETIFQEPQLHKLYRFNYYVNGKLIETNSVEYAGLTNNKRFYIFNYVGGANKEGHSCHLLRVGYFPTYQDSSNLLQSIFEHYLLIS